MIPSFISQLSPSSLFCSDANETSSSITTMGRCIKKLGSCAVSVAKVLGVFSLIIGFSFLPIVPALGCAVHVNTATSIFVTPAFPEYTPWFMNPGLQLARNGTTACNIEECLETKTTCEEITTAVLTHLEIKNTFDSIDQHLTFREKGIVANNQVVNGVSRTLHFRINARKFDNYEKALFYVEQTIFKYPEHYFATPKEFVSLIKTLHSILTQDLPDISIITPGKVRTFEKILSDTSRDQATNHAKRILSSPEFKEFNKIYNRFEASQFMLKFSDSERILWNKCFYVTVGPDNIERELANFAENFAVLFKEKFFEPQNKQDFSKLKEASIELASFVHTELMRIHPFVMANGRLARILVNTILFYYADINPIVIRDEAEYKKAIKQAFTDPKMFTLYLKNNVIPWTEKQSKTLLRTHAFTTLFTSMLH